MRLLECQSFLAFAFFAFTGAALAGFDLFEFRVSMGPIGSSVRVYRPRGGRPDGTWPSRGCSEAMSSGNWRTSPGGSFSLARRFGSFWLGLPIHFHPTQAMCQRTNYLGRFHRLRRGKADVASFICYGHPSPTVLTLFMENIRSAMDGRRGFTFVFWCYMPDSKFFFPS